MFLISRTLLMQLMDLIKNSCPPPPPDSAVDYFSRYQQLNFIVQAIVNGGKRFLDFASGFPGSMHDARVLRNSTIFDLAEHDQILTGPSVQIGGNDINSI